MPSPITISSPIKDLYNENTKLPIVHEVTMKQEDGFPSDMQEVNMEITKKSSSEVWERIHFMEERV